MNLINIPSSNAGGGYCRDSFYKVRVILVSVVLPFWELNSGFILADDVIAEVGLEQVTDTAEFTIINTLLGSNFLIFLHPMLSNCKFEILWASTFSHSFTELILKLSLLVQTIILLHNLVVKGTVPLRLQLHSTLQLMLTLIQFIMSL